MLITGPINVVRLEGTINYNNNNIKKILYVFFDYHEDIRYQTKCDSYESITIDTYLYNLFKNTKKTVDFFMEIRQDNFSDQNIQYQERYIENIFNLYNKLNPKNNKINKNKNKNKNKNINNNNINNNIRFHYLDIRDFLEKEVNDLVYILINQLNDVIQYKSITSYNFTNIYDSIMKIISKFSFFKNYFENKPIEIKENYKQIIYYLDKIMKKYNNNTIIEKINKTYIKDIIEKIDIYIKNLTEIYTMFKTIEREKSQENKLNYKKKIKWTDVKDMPNIVSGFYSNNDLPKEILNKISDLYYTIYTQKTEIFLKITDLFFLRRFLDKDYVNLAISYTGAAHSCNYINVLVELFDFKITHFSHSDEPNLKKLNNIAKTDFYKLNYILEPEYLIQCSDISGFPKDF